MTERFRQHSSQWRGTVGVRDEALAAMIRQDKIDILVDLTQHLADNRLPVFARRPAPVQTSFAGYPESAGLEAIGHRISDPHLEAARESAAAGPSDDSSPGLANAEHASRERVHLIDSFWCYDPSGLDVEVNAPPAASAGVVTFGCLNNFCKINEKTLGVWGRLLGVVKDSRLVMRSPLGSHRERALKALENQGIERRRVSFVEVRPRLEYLGSHHCLDIILDTFPYNGHTTSLDALWMGVPVVTLAGETPVSRAGLSQLTNLGLRELVAHTEAEYVSIAASLASDLPRLAELRATLRPRMQASPLMDAPRFARQIERAYREMWRAWLREQTSPTAP
jgi:predicted O-linked N-acetylglucosamine transferase (SPINDLY family)